MKLKDAVVEVIGLGQIGSSLASALVKRRLARKVVGFTRKPATLREALRRRIIHRGSTSPHQLFAPEANLIIFATPVRTILQHIRQIPPHFQPILYMDVGSTKQDILQAAQAHLPKINFIGGHPMAGNEKAGIAAYDPTLFVRRPFILIEAQVLDRQVTSWARELVRGLGARLVVMRDGAEHDLAMAVVSHLPYLLAYGLTHVTDTLNRRAFVKRYGADFLWKLAGPSFQAATRVAVSHPEMVFDFLWTNRQNLCALLDMLGAELVDVKRWLKSGKKEVLMTWLKHACQKKLNHVAL